MSRMRRLLYALSLGMVGFILPASTYAGGGVGGGGSGGLVVSVDNRIPANHNFSFLDFFPRAVTVHQGDVITFRWENNPLSFHTVSFLPAGAALSDRSISQVYPGSQSPVPDADDSNKSPVFQYKQHQLRGCGNSAYFPGTGPCVFDGRTPLNSGLQLPALNPRTGQPIVGAPPVTFVVRFTASPGVYHWVCLVHGGGMNGTVRVVPAGAPIPSLAAQAAAATRQYQAGAGNAIAHTQQTLSHIPPPTAIGGHTTWNALAGDQYGRVEIDEFFPRTLNIKRGDTVKWFPGGFHTVSSLNVSAPAFPLECETAGPRDLPFQGRFAGCDLESGLGPSAFPSGPPGQTWTGKPLNSGILVIPQPHVWSVSFGQGGTLQYQCLIHANMHGVVASR